MKLRPYQAAISQSVRDVWARNGVPLAVLPTGAGKTVVFCRLIAEHDGYVVAIAHRRELVLQMSIALGREGIRHRIIAPEKTITTIVAAHMRVFGNGVHFYDPTSRVAVAGVDSLKKANDKWRARVSLAVIDEAHHVLRANKWGAALALFPAAKLLGVTATPKRADGKGLGAHASGVFTHICEGPSMRDLIAQGYLTDYRIFSPPSAFDLSALRVGSTGDYTRASMSKELRKAKITGDIVGHYMRHARGKLGVTFAVDVAASKEIAAAYNAAGVPALSVDAKTPTMQRVAALEQFAARKVLQLVNVDLFGEGFDLPAIEVVSMARPTKSWPLFVQQFGRALRPLPGKAHAIIVDHVGNVHPTHGLPDATHAHSLDARGRKTGKRGPIRTTTCAECGATYERIEPACPYCKTAPVPASRANPEHVAGDLVELSQETLDAMRAAVAKVDRTPGAVAEGCRRAGYGDIVAATQAKHQRAAQESQEALRFALAWWAGWQRDVNDYDDRRIYRAFYLAFGVDAMSARALRRQDADALHARIVKSLPVTLREQIPSC